MPDEREPVQVTPPREASRRERARGWAERWAARGRAGILRLERERPRHATVEIGFRWFVRDKQIAGGVLGGGLAYRLFFWVLAITLLVSGGLGVASESGVAVTRGIKDSGLSAELAKSVGTAARESRSGRWWLILLGAYFTLWFSWGVLRALRLVSSAAWQIAPPKLRNAAWAILVVLSTPVILVVVTIGSEYVRAHSSPVLGLAVTLLAGVGFAVLALLAMIWLPSRDVPWTAFVPGAVVLGIGIEALHIFTVYFLASRLENASQLYGTLGLASTALFYLFLIGRGIVWAAELNAVAWEVRHPDAPRDPDERMIFPNL
jgi:Virulence factor BrkB